MTEQHIESLDGMNPEKELYSKIVVGITPIHNKSDYLVRTQE